MAGTRITQQMPKGIPGRRYGDFSGRAPFVPPVSASDWLLRARRRRWLCRGKGR